MEQHAIPQQISSYQFRLVGDMTLKQFFQLAGGLLVSLLFYASKLHPLVKWPFIIFFALLGVALAFLPFEERPLEKWIVSFFRSIYSPTLFSWAKSATNEKFYQDEDATTTGVVTPGTEKVTSVGPIPGFGGSRIFSKLEDTEKSFLKSIGQLFGGTKTPVAGETMPIAPAAAPTKKEELIVPMNMPTQIATPGYQAKVVVEEAPAAPAPVQQVKFTNVAQTLVGKGSDAQQAQFSVAASPPNPPTQPNTVVGQVFDNEGKIVNGAILEIRDVAGRPVRALRSNMLGHFIIVTPLVNGRYEIITEKENLVFDPISFEATGAIVPPIVIRAKSSQKVIRTEELPVQPAQL
jgi:hypothetical protein